MSDKLQSYGKFTVVVDELSVPYLSGSTLDWVKEGLNEFFKIINPKEQSSCGCGVSIQFYEDLVSESKG
jgi:iron-sulfur cluster assembly protein